MGHCLKQSIQVCLLADHMALYVASGGGVVIDNVHKGSIRGLYVRGLNHIKSI